jgi:hypothetical protein
MSTGAAFLPAYQAMSQFIWLATPYLYTIKRRINFILKTIWFIEN